MSVLFWKHWPEPFILCIHLPRIQPHVCVSKSSGQGHRSEKDVTSYPVTPSVTDLVQSHFNCSDGKSILVVHTRYAATRGVRQVAYLDKQQDIQWGIQSGRPWCGPRMADLGWQTEWQRRKHDTVSCSQMVCLRLKGSLVTLTNSLNSRMFNTRGISSCRMCRELNVNQIREMHLAA